MGEPAAPHRLGIFLADRPLVAGGERGRDRPARSGQRCANVAVEPVANRVESAAGAGFDDSQRPDRTSDTANPPEPGVAREIVADPGSAIGGGGWSRARSSTTCALADPGWRVLFCDRHADSRGSALPGRRQREPQIALRRQRLDPLDRRRECDDRRAFEARRGDLSARTQIKAQPRHRASPNQPSARSARPSPSGPAKQRQPGGQTQEARPLARARTARTRRRCPLPKPTTNHGGSWPRSRSSQVSSATAQPSQTPAPFRRRARWQRRILYVRGADPFHRAQDKGKRA